ncbi:MAG: hypothetical protein C4536_12545 [Actinobacteria bacterium]|jgi:ABC-type glycerol-3-phosphate transport system substrate-binding protein|nr:MAG: hypothetical protein C4536_12545 [Actinomycetota bacterium]
MKRAVVVFLVAALALSMLAVLAGCGSDADKDEAMQLMKSGDAYMAEVKQMTKDLEAEQTDLAAAALEGDMSAISGEAGAALQEMVMGILDAIAENLEAASAEYEKIIALSGVQDYKDYANKMIEAIGVYMEQLDYTGQLVDMLTEALAAMAAGEDIDIISLMMDSEELKKVGELGQEGDALAAEAKQIQEDKKLEE